MNAPERRQREIERTREDILEAAGRAFVRAGVDGATMQEIAREAGYTAASLYTYFRSKQEIVEAMVNQLTAEYLRILEEPLPSNLSFEQRFGIVLLRQLELIDNRREVILSFHAAGQEGCLCPAEGHARIFHDQFERRIKGLAQWFANNATSTDLGGHAPDLVARFLVGMAFGLLHSVIGEGRTEDRLVDRAPVIQEFFFHGVSGCPKAGAKRK